MSGILKVHDSVMFVLALDFGRLTLDLFVDPFQFNELLNLVITIFSVTSMRQASAGRSLLSD